MILEESEAIGIAERVAIQEGWLWDEPIIATPKYERGKIKLWEIRSNTSWKGCNAWIVINAETGEILDKKYLPR